MDHYKNIWSKNKANRRSTSSNGVGEAGSPSTSTPPRYGHFTAILYLLFYMNYVVTYILVLRYFHVHCVSIFGILPAPLFLRSSNTRSLIYPPTNPLAMLSIKNFINWIGLMCSDNTYVLTPFFSSTGQHGRSPRKQTNGRAAQSYPPEMVENNEIALQPDHPMASKVSQSGNVHFKFRKSNANTVFEILV